MNQKEYFMLSSNPYFTSSKSTFCKPTRCKTRIILKQFLLNKQEDDSSIDTRAVSTALSLCFCLPVIVTCHWVVMSITIWVIPMKQI